MILPIIAAISREVFRQVPTADREAALALGATRWEMIRLAVLPYSRGGIIGAVMLGLGRALGETIAVALVLAAAFEIDFHILEPGGNTIAANIATKFGEAGDHRPPGPDRQRPRAVRHHPRRQRRRPRRRLPQRPWPPRASRERSAPTCRGRLVAAAGALVNLAACTAAGARRRRGPGPARCCAAATRSSGALDTVSLDFLTHSMKRRRPARRQRRRLPRHPRHARAGRPGQPHLRPARAAGGHLPR